MIGQNLPGARLCLGPHFLRDLPACEPSAASPPHLLSGSWAVTTGPRPCPLPHQPLRPRGQGDRPGSPRSWWGLKSGTAEGQSDLGSASLAGSQQSQSPGGVPQDRAPNLGAQCKMKTQVLCSKISENFKMATQSIKPSIGPGVLSPGK